MRATSIKLAASCAVLALTVGSGLTLAQAPEARDKDQPGQAQQGQAQQGQAQQGQSAPKGRASPETRSPAAQPSKGDRGAENRTKRDQQAGQAGPAGKDRDNSAAKTNAEGKADRGERKATDKAAGRENSKSDRAQSERQQGRAKDRDNRQGSAQQRQRDQQAQSKSDADQKRDQQRSDGTDQRQRNAQPQQAEQRRQGQQDQQNRAAERSQDRTGANVRTRISEEQRSTVRQRFVDMRLRAQVSNPRFSVSIGTRVPRSVRIAAIPASIIAVAPAYRDYRYFVADDRIVIIEPRTYEIVDVIDYGSGPGHGSRPMSASLELTSQERAFILSNLPRDRARADFRFDLALGADVPERVTMEQFPVAIVREVPKLEAYRYVVVGDDIVIAEPRSRDIALILH